MARVEHPTAGARSCNAAVTANGAGETTGRARTSTSALMAIRNNRFSIVLTLALSGVTGCQSPAPTTEADVHDCHARPRDASDAEVGSLVVRGTATLNVEPDVADVRMDLQATARSPSLAASQLRSAEAKMRANLDDSGVGNEQLRASALTLDPVMTWNAPRERKVLTGYQATLTVTVSTEAFETVPDILEAATDAGVASVAMSFRSTKMPELKARVRQLALDAAKAKVEQFESALDVSTARVMAVSESQSGAAWSAFGSPLDNFRANAVEAMVVPDGGAVLAGMQPLTLSVDVRYELAS